VRNSRRSGKRVRTAHTMTSRYLREVRSRPETHGLVLRCANCHRWRSVMHQRALRGIDGTPSHGA
jgi:predicted HNH restriction endonuclease